MIKPKNKHSYIFVFALLLLIMFILVTAYKISCTLGTSTAANIPIVSSMPTSIVIEVLAKGMVGNQEITIFHCSGHVFLLTPGGNIVKW